LVLEGVRLVPRFAIVGPGPVGGASIAALLACCAPAAAKPTVTLDLPNADAGARIAYSYASGHVPSHAKLVVQRQVGTARQFKTVATLTHAPSGTGTLAPLDRVVTPRQSWGINVASLGPNDLDFYVNGSASCYSRSLV
jgi:hypothetical protein